MQPEQTPPAALTVTEPGVYRLEHLLGHGAEIWKIGDEYGMPLDEPELTDLVITPLPAGAGLGSGPGA